MGLYFLLLTEEGRAAVECPCNVPRPNKVFVLDEIDGFCSIFKQKLSDCDKQSLCPASYCTIAGL